MSRVVKVVDQRIAAVQGPIQVLFLAGLLISFGVAAAAGMFSFSRTAGRCGRARRPRMGSRIRRVSRPCSESILPCVVGAVIGFLVATAMIAWIGPTGVDRPGGARVGAGRFAGRDARRDRARRRRLRAHVRVAPRAACRALSRVAFIVPWEILALGGAYVAARRLHARGGVLGTTVERPAPTVFLFPLLLALGVAILAARLIDPRALAAPPRGSDARLGVVPGGPTARLVLPARRWCSWSPRRSRSRCSPRRRPW